MKGMLCGIVLGMGLPALLAAQAPGAVRGRVVDAASGAPIASARIELDGTTVLSGADGRFELGGVRTGVATMTVAAVGYRPTSRQVDLLPGIEVERTVRLAAMTPILPDIRVVGVEGPEMSLDHDALVRRGADLASAIDGWQGIVVRRSGGNGPASPQIQGSAPEEVIVLLDGFSINDPLTGRADLSRVATRDVASVRVRAGAQSAGAGGAALGGVITIRSQSLSGSEASGWAASHGSGGAALARSLAGARAFVRGERLPDGFPHRVPANRGGGIARRQNAGGTVGQLTFRRPGRVSVQARASASERGLPGALGNETPTARADDRTGFLGVSLTGSSTWNGSLQYLRSEASDATPPSGPAYRARSEGWSATMDWSGVRPVSFAGWRGHLELGAGARHDQFSGDVVREGTRFTRGGVRATATLRPHGDSPWTLTPSARVDQWTGESHPLASGRLDAGWQRRGSSLHASLGSAVSAPPLADLFFREGVGVALNPGLRPERVRWEVELGLEQDWQAFGRPAMASVHGHYGRVQDMIIWAPGVAFIWSPRNFDVTRRGVDAAVGIQPLRGVSLEVHGAWTPVTYDVPGGAQVQYRPRATWGATAGWADGRWGADARWRWVGERFPNPGGVNPRPAFGLLDLGTERAVGSAVLRADLRDVFDARAEFLAGYPTTGRTAVFSISLEWP
jgi:iron complex outermembrane receptor protein